MVTANICPLSERKLASPLLERVCLDSKHTNKCVQDTLLKDPFLTRYWSSEPARLNIHYRDNSGPRSITVPSDGPPNILLLDSKQCKHSIA